MSDAQREAEKVERFCSGCGYSSKKPLGDFFACCPDSQYDLVKIQDYRKLESRIALLEGALKELKSWVEAVSEDSNCRFTRIGAKSNLELIKQALKPSSGEKKCEHDQGKYWESLERNCVIEKTESFLNCPFCSAPKESGNEEEKT